MTTIALRKYDELINSLIDQEKYKEAISHCTTILNSYPKCIETYQTLGRALLENRQFEEAENVFSKILSVFPEDFSAHAALSEINEENRELDTAIWHMERAFETKPSNLNIQEEMRRLIGRRDGTPPAKVRLTRGALIRMYAKGDLYQQAIAETLSAIETDPDRLDLKVLLARFYHATGADAEAALICAEILSSAPYCYEANRIMFDITSHSNDFKYDPIYQERLSELDPYYQFVEDSKEDVKSIPDEKVILDMIDFIPDQSVTSSELDWAQKIGLSWQESLDEITEIKADVDTFPDETNPDSEAAIDELQAIPFIEDITEIKPESGSDASESQEDSIPDWITKAGWIRATDEEVPPTPFDVSSSDLIDESGISPAEPANDLPDWLQTLKPETLEAPEVLTPTGEAAELDTEIPPLTPELLNEILADEDIKTLNSLAKPGEEAVFEAEISRSEEKVTDLVESINDESIPDLPDWLKDLDTGEINLPQDITFVAENEVVLDQEVRSEMPDFIDELSSTNLLGPDDSLVEAEEPLEPAPPVLKIDDGIVELEPPESAPENVELQPAVSESIENTEGKPPVPSWVSKILASSATVTPIVSAEPLSRELIPVAPEKEAETIPELIQDLPEIESGEGVISSEVNKELESWLSEISPEETSPIGLPFEPEIPLPAEEISPLISFDTLVGPLTTEEPLEVGPEMITEPVDLAEELADSSNLQDRLSSMLGIEPTLETPKETEETIFVTEEPVVASGLREKLSQFLRSGEYSSFLNTISAEELPVETADDVILEINEELKRKPDTFELWQSLGDMQSKKANLGDALSAYKEAEKHLFQ